MVGRRIVHEACRRRWWWCGCRAAVGVVRVPCSGGCGMGAVRDGCGGCHAAVGVVGGGCGVGVMQRGCRPR